MKTERTSKVEPGHLRRRDFIKGTVVFGAAALTALESHDTAVAETETRRGLGAKGIIDTNLSLSLWPFRRLPLDETPKLVAKLRSAGVVQGWAASFDGVLHKNIAAANERLVEECRRHGRGMLLPFGTVNPKLPDWEEDLRRCHEIYKMRGIRLFPNYHGYNLGDPQFSQLLKAAEARGLLVQLTMSMEDERVQHPLMRVPDVDVTLLPRLLKELPHLKVMLLNWFRGVKGDLLARLAATGQVWFDIAMVEGVGGVANLLKNVPAEQLVFGSHAPFFYLESALLKLKESPLSPEQARLIQWGSSARLMK